MIKLVYALYTEEINLIDNLNIKHLCDLLICDEKEFIEECSRYVAARPD